MKLLLIAYKIEKDKGSEDGTGYHIAELLGQKLKDMTLITRGNNIPKLKNDPAFKNINLIGVDVPKVISFYKKKGRGVILYYYLWQIMVGLKIRQLQKTQNFNVIHQLNFHAMWAPHFIFSKARIVWGPLTQHPDIPFRYWNEGLSGFAGELVKRVVKTYFIYGDPFLKWAIRRTDRILLGQDKKIGSYKTTNRIRIIPQARSSFPVLANKPIKPQFSILFVGRYVSLKGCMIAMQALGKMLANLSPEQQSNVNIHFIGEGPLESKIKVYAHHLGYQTKAHISVHPWQDQPALLEYYRRASLFLFPSFEAQGLVVAEALSQGCPVLCLENSGPHSVAGDASITVSQSDPIDKLATKLIDLAYEYWYQPEEYEARITKSLKRAHYLTWDRMAEELMGHYHD